MLLSHYEILACGTALWKLLDLTVFAQGLLINSPLNDGVCPKQTAHVTDERERQRAKGKLTGPERQATTALLLFTEEVYPVCLFGDRLSLLLLLAGWCHHATPSYCSHLQCPVARPPLFFPLTPASCPLPPHLLRQCRLPRFHNPLS